MKAFIQASCGFIGAKSWFFLMGLLSFLLFFSAAFASENERYRVIPASPSGTILIIDTQEGYLWTWNSNGTEETNAVGVNPRIRYQGNVRKNMNPPTQSLPSPGKEDIRF